MLKIHIKEINTDGQTVTILADGSLDRDTIPILSDVCQRHWKEEREVHLHLDGLIRISREGIGFLQEIQEKVTFIKPPKFIKLDRKEPEELD